MSDQVQILFDKLRPQYEKPSAKWWTLFVFMWLIFAVGIVALIQQIKYGHIVTGMRDYVPWGLFITNFIFFLGLSYAGALISTILHLTKISWSKPLIRIIELFTFITLCVGPLFIFLCVGRLDRLHHLFLYARIQSPITWDVIAILTDLVFCFVYLYITHLRDFARLRDYKDLNVASWKKKLYKWLAIGYQGTPEQVKYLNQAQNILAAIIIPTSIIAYSLLAWLFGMNLRPGWHSSIFAPHFVLTAVYSGIALLIVLMWIYRKIYKLQAYIKDQHFYYLGFALLILALLFGYFSFSEYITDWYNLNKTTEKWLMKFFTFNEFGGVYLLFNIIAVFLPIIVLIVPRFRSVNSISVVSFLIVIGLWLKRYLIIVPTLETPYLPIQDLRPEYVHYKATWVEWALTFAGVAFCVILFMMFNKLAPVIPVSEYDESSEEIVVPSPFYKSYESK